MMEDGGRPTSRTKLLVQSVLSHADRLQLSDRQIADLSRIYWATDERWSNPNLVADIASLLSRGQLLLAMSYHTTQEEMPIYPVAGSSEAVREMVTSALTEQMKDKALVEVELATKVADRLIAWSKVFGFFVAAPVAVLLLILSLFGWSKFEDIRKAAGRADTLVQQAQSRLSEAKEKLASTERQILEVSGRANERSREIDAQLAELKAMSDKNSSRLSSLDQAVRQIETQLGSISRSNNNPNVTFRQKFDEGQFDAYYGPWGMSESVVKKFVTRLDFPWKDQFENLEPDSKEFEEVWKKLAPTDSKRFLEAQRSFIREKLYEPVAKAMLERFGLDLSKRSEALRDAVFMSVSHTDLTGDPLQACKRLHDTGGWRPSEPGFDEALIRSILGSDRTSLEDALRRLEAETRR